MIHRAPSTPPSLALVDRAGAGPQAAAGVAAWTDQAFARLTGFPGVHRAGLALVEGGGRRLRFTASDREVGPDVAWCDVDAYDDVPLNTAVRSGKPVVGSLAELHGPYPAYVDRQHGTPTVALAAVPIVAAGQTLGAYLLLFDRPQPFDRRHALDLARLGRELGAALRHALSRERRRTKFRMTSEPLPEGAKAVTHEVDAHPSAVSRARQFLRQTLAGWGVDEEVEYTAALCLSELVTNALIHSHGGCLVRTVLHDGVLTTTVLDWGTADAAAVGSVEDPLQVHGRGLQVVDALADRWGHVLDDDGASAWFALSVG
jgi:anti-sigma regulatory factor (Ser/Thr protein kinase)